MFFIIGMEQTQCNIVIPVLDVRFCSYVWIGLLDTNASVIIGSLKPLKCKIWQRNELFELNLLRFHQNKTVFSGGFFQQL
jgi:hypothetical protein